ncbi:hypothetical protein VPH35_114461 [Triticum aestivum]
MDITAGVMGSVLSKLDKLLKEEYNLPSGAKEDLKYVAEEQRRLQAYFCSMTDAPPDQLDKFDRGWLSKISEAFRKSENIVDILMVECSKPAADPGVCRRLFRRTRDSLNPPHQDPKDLIARIKEITLDVLDVFATHKHLDGCLRPLYKDEKDLVCIDGPKDVLIKMLTEGDDMSMNQQKIVSIVGLGGLGKTTLAHVVYHRLKPQFDCVAFVRVPLKPDMVGLFTEMLYQLDVKNHININEEAMDNIQPVSLIRGFLLNKRYLIVIDDLWNEDDLHSISSSLPSNDKGSRVITTTRVNGIANLCCSGGNESMYEVQCLGYQNSRELFLKHYFRHGSWPDADTDIFDDIIRMCSGTPSAIISIASLLATKVTAQKPWQEMMNYLHCSSKQMPSSLGFKSENIPGFEDLRDILSLIYAHLPSPLKDCLLYLAVHAKNQIIHRTTMVRKWISEGFISENARHSREEVASGYFDELISRSFIRLSEYDNYSREEMYEVNSMVLYVLRQISDKEHFATILSGVGISRDYAHYFRLSVQCSGTELPVMDSSRIRSTTIAGPAKIYLNHDWVYLRVLDLDGYKDLQNSDVDHICRMTLLKYLSLKHTPVTIIPPKIRRLHSLETLDLGHTEISNLPPEIGQLQNLKTLDAGGIKISCLPPEIGKLQNLETLDVRQTKVKELPKELVRLPKLAYLYFGDCNSARGVKLPVGSDQLKSVKVLGTVDSRECSGNAMEEISGLTRLREIEVMLYDQPADMVQNDKLMSSIGKCVNLEYLIIYGDYSPSNELPVSPYFRSLERLKVAGRFMKVPRWLAELTMLRKLDIRVCQLDQDDLKILGALPSLSTLALELICIILKKDVTITSKLHPEEETIPEDCFPKLEVFSFDCHVPWITFQQGAMSTLKHFHLKLYACPDYKFPSGIINLPSLEKISLRYSSDHAISGSITKAVATIREQAATHDIISHGCGYGLLEKQQGSGKTIVDPEIVATKSIRVTNLLKPVLIYLYLHFFLSFVPCLCTIILPASISHVGSAFELGSRKSMFLRQVRTYARKTILVLNAENRELQICEASNGKHPPFLMSWGLVGEVQPGVGFFSRNKNKDAQQAEQLQALAEEFPSVPMNLF